MVSGTVKFPICFSINVTGSKILWIFSIGNCNFNDILNESNVMKCVGLCSTFPSTFSAGALCFSVFFL